MAKFKLYEKRGIDGSKTLISEHGNMASVKKAVERKLDSHDRTCELSDSMDALTSRGYCCIGWSSTVLYLEEIAD